MQNIKKNLEFALPGKKWARSLAGFVGDVTVRYEENRKLIFTVFCDPITQTLNAAALF